MDCSSIGRIKSNDIKFESNPIDDMTYLSFKHIANKKNHHASINFVFRTPLEPPWYSLTNLTPNVI